MTTASLPALRHYVQGVRANVVEGDFPKSIALLEEAIALDRSFAMAYRRLGVFLSNQVQDRARTTAATIKAYEHRDRLPERERHLAVGTYHTIVAHDRGRALAAYRALLETHPADFIALNNISVVYGDM